MVIAKRSGTQVEFDLTKICRAIGAATREVDEDQRMTEADILSVAHQMENELKEYNGQVSVEDIQDLVELALMSEPKFAHTAKRYIIYRTRKNEERGNKAANQSTLLPSEFISDYKHTPLPFDEMGTIVAARTYQRRDFTTGIREEWYETIRRAVEFNCSLATTSAQEAQKLYENIFYGKQFLSGRTLWIGGTPAASKFPMSNFNCAFLVVDTIQAFCDLFYCLMIGSGVGARILKEDIAKLPSFRTNCPIVNQAYKAVPAKKRQDYTSLNFERYGEDFVAVVSVGDSKEGWVQSLKYVLEILSMKQYNNIKSIRMVYDNTRPNGEQLKTFGGTASGPEALMDLFVVINAIMERRQKDGVIVPLKTIDVLDILNSIGASVVVGGVRRTSEILLFDPDDEECLQAKSNIFEKVGNQWIVNQELKHRQMSNNSIFYQAKPTREQLHKQMETMRYNGEPGFINAAAALKRRPTFKGVNPCAEILLPNMGMCNLTTVNVFGFVENNVLDFDGLLEAQRLSVRAGIRMSLVEFELHDWNVAQHEERIIGTSITGWQDAVNACGMSKDDEKDLLSTLRKVAHEEVTKCSRELGIDEPILTTTVKPEGTLSRIPGVSSGVHYSFSPYYLRRVRMTATDPLLKACEELGYEVVPEVGETEENCRTKVVSFPCQSPDGKTTKNVSAIEQLENYKMFMENYCDHNVSISVTVRPHEWEQCEQWVWDNWGSIVAVSFIAEDGGVYPLAPYEEITADEYIDLSGKMKTFRKSILDKYDAINHDEAELIEEDCASGACPIR